MTLEYYYIIILYTCLNDIAFYKDIVVRSATPKVPPFFFSRLWFLPRTETPPPRTFANPTRIHFFLPTSIGQGFGIFLLPQMCHLIYNVLLSFGFSF